MKRNIVYLSIDVETDGQVPGLYSMLSLGAAAFSVAGGNKPISTFSVNFELLPGAKQSEATMRWWAEQPAAWNAHRTSLKTPVEGMREFFRWIDDTRKENFVKLAAWPAAFDSAFVMYYSRLILPDGVLPPFGFDTLDIRSFAAGVLERPYTGATKKKLPAWCFSGIETKHNHVAVTDAVEQGIILMNLIRYQISKGSVGEIGEDTPD